MSTPRGLTIVEMIVTIAIVGLIGTAIVDSVLFFYRANSSSLEQGQQVEAARRGVELFVRDVREATYADTGAYPLETVASSSIVFYADTDGDTGIERIRYSLSGMQLFRNVTDATGTPPVYSGGGVTSTVSKFVRNFDENAALFQYYNASSTEVTSSQFINTIVSVTISPIVDIVQKHAPGKFTLTESATIRNLRAQ
jgi:prepilin-type N-terminal cleavage/methylation domain-containing protein